MDVYIYLHDRERLAGNEAAITDRGVNGLWKGSSIHSGCQTTAYEEVLNCVFTMTRRQHAFINNAFINNLK